MRTSTEVLIYAIVSVWIKIYARYASESFIEVTVTFAGILFIATYFIVKAIEKNHE